MAFFRARIFFFASWNLNSDGRNSGYPRQNSSESESSSRHLANIGLMPSSATCSRPCRTLIHVGPSMKEIVCAMRSSLAIKSFSESVTSMVLIARVISFLADLSVTYTLYATMQSSDLMLLRKKPLFRVASAMALASACVAKAGCWGPLLTAHMGPPPAWECIRSRRFDIFRCAFRSQKSLPPIISLPILSSPLSLRLYASL
mmetsp:Transcript_8587/g.15869  ORF Transcript_8587/g.15869 Transcript_8587/m.15869 type:complete len:202 (-) Transcript_8587:130-735(-)